MAWPRNGERPSRRTTGGLLRRISPALCRAGETSEAGEARVTAKAKGAAGTNEGKEPVRSTVMRGCAEGQAGYRGSSAIRIWSRRSTVSLPRTTFGGLDLGRRA
jgi:hypothetical protein